MKKKFTLKKIVQMFIKNFVDFNWNNLLTSPSYVSFNLIEEKLYDFHHYYNLMLQ